MPNITFTTTCRWKAFENFGNAEIIIQFNPFVPSAPFLYPLKSLGNVKVFWCFQGVEKGCIGNKWVKITTFCKKNWTINFQNLCMCTVDVLILAHSRSSIVIGHINKPVQKIWHYFYICIITLWKWYPKIFSCGIL